MRTELRFVDDSGKAFWIEVERDIITLVIDEQGVPITARLDLRLAQIFKRELIAAIKTGLSNRVG